MSQRPVIPLRALGLKPHERSPFPREITALGCAEDDELDGDPWDASWRQSIEMQRELIKIAGWPDCRSVYEKNLQEAQSSLAYAQEMVDHPERGGYSGPHQMEWRKEQLARANANLQWREELLAGLDEVKL